MNKQGVAAPIAEALSVASLCVMSLLCAHYFQDFLWTSDGSMRWVSVALLLAPILWVFFLARLILPRWYAVALVGSVTLLLSRVHDTKISLTGDPLVWSDLTMTSNLSVVGHYLTWQHIVLLAALGGLLGFLIYRRPGWRWSRSQAATALCATALLSPFVLFPFTDRLSRSLYLQTRYALADLGVVYYAWDWPTNVQKNGLPLHLLYTSKRPVPSRATPEQSQKYIRLSQQPAARIERATDTVVFILCEACWHGDTHFRELFDGLVQRGFQPFRAVSPAYGGSTVNAAFELLTGLPAWGSLQGVIYQEYADLLSEQAQALPRQLRASEYRTMAAHNHYRRFWRRDLVNPKLGFETFLGLEDMNNSYPIWTRDKVLYDKALEWSAQTPGKQFMFLTTAYTHGGYSWQGDFGQKNYSERLWQALRDLEGFVDALLGKRPNSVILMVGDHKPSLNRFFFENGIMPASEFSEIGRHDGDFRLAASSSVPVRGDVPGYLYSPKAGVHTTLVEQAQGKPFFCLSALVNQYVLGVSHPVFNYAEERRLCDEYVPERYNAIVESYPEWLFAQALFSED